MTRMIRGQSRGIRESNTRVTGTMSDYYKRTYRQYSGAIPVTSQVKNGKSHRVCSNHITSTVVALEGLSESVIISMMPCRPAYEFVITRADSNFQAVHAGARIVQRHVQALALAETRRAGVSTVIAVGRKRVYSLCPRRCKMGIANFIWIDTSSFV